MNLPVNYELKNYKFICDYCKKVEFVREVYSWERPKGWNSIETHGWGMTNYSRHEDLCPDCTQKEYDKVGNK
jgi:hypothetical protein